MPASGAHWGCRGSATAPRLSSLSPEPQSGTNVVSHARTQTVWSKLWEPRSQCVYTRRENNPIWAAAALMSNS